MMPSSPRLSRRAMLRGAGAMVALPLLEGMLTSRAWACGGGLPKRFGLFFWGNGNVPDRWLPVGEGQGSAWRLSPQLQPLERHKDVLCVPTGLGVKFPNLYPHGSGFGGLLAASPLAGDSNDTVQGPTIDQRVAAAIGRDTLYPSLQTAASETSGMSFSGPNARHPAERDPHALYARMFGDTFVEPGSGGLVDPSLGLRRSVLDAVKGDLDRLKPRLGTADRARLDQHLTGLRELETRLARLQEDPPDLEACSRPDEPEGAYPDLAGRPQLAARNKAMAELLAMAFACDQTRVFAHFVNEPVQDTLFPDAEAGHHSLTHDEPGAQPQVDAITTFCVGLFADLVDSVRAIPEGGGTLLDSCLLMACTEVSQGRTHALDDLPIVFAGSACGAIRQDVHYRSATDENVSKVLLTVMRAMDVPAAEIGIEEGRVTESLTVIEA
jgi:hypothetical protein